MPRSSADAHLAAALRDVTTIDSLGLDALAALHELVEDLIVEQYTNEESDYAVVSALSNVADHVWGNISELRQWTLFTTCVSSGEWWVEAGKSRAITAFERWLGYDPFDSCSTCGDTCFHIVDRPLGAIPSADAEVIAAAEVATLLAPSAADAS